MARLRTGDMSAFDELYRRYERRLYGYIRRLVADDEGARDLFQEVFFKVLEDRSYDPDRGRFSAWVFTVARNRCLEQHRKATTRSLLSSSALPLETSDPPDALGDALERRRWIRTAFEDMSEGHRQVLLLKQVGELTYAEIAQMLGLAEGTIKSRLHAAMKQFRRRLAELAEG